MICSLLNFVEMRVRKNKVCFILTQMLSDWEKRVAGTLIVRKDHPTRRTERLARTFVESNNNQFVMFTVFWKLSRNTFPMRKTFASATDLRECGIPSRNTLAAYEMTPKMSWGGFLVKNLRKVEYPRMRFPKPTVPTLWLQVPTF